MPVSLPSLRLLDGECGYVISPFTSMTGLPTVLIRADIVMRYSTADVSRSIHELDFSLERVDHPVDGECREAYHEDFCRFQRTFSSSHILKLVLARTLEVAHRRTDPLLLFEHACKRYPEAFVTLFLAPQCGMWLMATPEVLLTHDDTCWHTMALAGTMRYSDPLPSWSQKNVNEQAYVSRYINECLVRYCHDVNMNGPYTTRAGNLVHLRTDFSFSLNGDTRVGELLHSLHPTPAVCGLPKQEAQQFIMDNESIDRSYYSGFSGPFNLGGQTALYVSLRCMRILADRYRLYAGGGILPQSEESLEWDETAAKMQAMLSLID